jgi:hypothetical protein
MIMLYDDFVFMRVRPESRAEERTFSGDYFMEIESDLGDLERRYQKKRMCVTQRET